MPIKALPSPPTIERAAAGLKVILRAYLAKRQCGFARLSSARALDAAAMFYAAVLRAFIRYSIYSCAFKSSIRSHFANMPIFGIEYRTRSRPLQ